MKIEGILAKTATERTFPSKKYSLSHYILQVLTEQYKAIVSG